MISGGALCSFGPQLVVDASKVFDETPILAFSFHFVRISKQGRWMNGHPNYGGKRSTPRASSNVPEPNRFAEDGLSGRDAEADDHPRFYDLDLSLQPWTAGGNFAYRRLLVLATLALRFPLEVLHRIGDIDLSTANSGFSERLA